MRRGKIIGVNNISKVQVVKESGQVDAHVLAVGLKASALLVIGAEKRSCYGALIAGGDRPRILTSRQCFTTARAQERIDTTLCDKTWVYFNFSLKGEELVERRCHQGTLYTSIQSDLAVFSLRQRLPDSHRPFRIWRGEIPVGQETFLLHYPYVLHDYSAPSRSVTYLPQQQKYFPILAVSADDCNVYGRPKHGVWSKIPFGLAHSCDMTKGSNGAALVDFNSGQLLGIGWGGLQLVPTRRSSKVNLATSAEHLLVFLGRASSGE